jgi:hypothetical protein
VDIKYMLGFLMPFFLLETPMVNQVYYLQFNQVYLVIMIWQSTYVEVRAKRSKPHMGLS